jgi:hypothetical protein
VLVCFLTAVPSLVIGVLIEVPPLAAPEDGVVANWVFWIRFWAVGCFVVVCGVTQMHQYASRLEIKPYQVITIALLSSTVGCAFVFTVAKTTVFPVPFAALVATPPIVIAMFSCCVLFWGKQWKAAPPSLQFDVKRHLAVLIAELSLTFVYPVFILGFVSLSGVAQSLFAVALPFIKLAGKNVISRLVGDRNDVKPEIVIFNVEVFHALYVAAALQGATSYTSTTMIMIVDLAQFWISMHDVAQVVSEIENLMQKIPLDHPAAAMNFVQIALSLQVPTLEKHATIMDSLSCSVDGGIVQKVGGNSANGRQMTPVVPSNTPSRSSKRLIIGKVQVVPAAPFHWKDVDLNAIFTPEERSRLLSKTLHVLFITEYLVLAEYTEVMLPLIYCECNVFNAMRQSVRR